MRIVDISTPFGYSENEITYSICFYCLTQVDVTSENAENIWKIKQSYLKVWARNIQISQKINATYWGKIESKQILKRQSLNCCRAGTLIAGAGSVSDLKSHWEGL